VTYRVCGREMTVRNNSGRVAQLRQEAYRAAVSFNTHLQPAAAGAIMSRRG